MRILLFIAGFICLSREMTATAEDRKFPYEAVVVADDGEEVLSGPGKKFYPTQKLQKGDRVMVHRHDFGWCMIAPPPESFSWVRADYVQRSAGETDRGVLKTSRVVVHVGSALNPDDFMIVQGSLSKGDPIEIIGEREFRFEDGARLMYKIRPVKLEWRWIARKSIDAVDSIKSDPFPADGPNRKKRRGPVADRMDADYFARPVSTNPALREDDSNSSSNSESLPSDGGAIRRTGPGSDQSVPGRQKLNEIDDRFREMIRQEPPTWDLDSLDSQYQQLDDDVGEASLSTLIRLREDAVKRYRKIYKDYVDFNTITSETKQRDAQLTMQQPLTGSQNTIATSTGTASQPAGPPLRPSSQQPATGSSPQPTPNGGVPAFDGAGIVQRMAKSFPGGPQFVLLAPDGRMLSMLQPTQGVDLNRYVGRSMGIIGQRMHRDDWNTDVIVVRDLKPVQLRGNR